MTSVGCGTLTHVNLVELKVDKCPFCGMKLLTKEEYQKTLEDKGLRGKK